jgi:hypothetical protein
MDEARERAVDAPHVYVIRHRGNRLWHSAVRALRLLVPPLGPPRRFVRPCVVRLTVQFFVRDRSSGERQSIQSRFEARNLGQQAVEVAPQWGQAGVDFAL